MLLARDSGNFKVLRTGYYQSFGLHRVRISVILSKDRYFYRVYRGPRAQYCELAIIRLLPAVKDLPFVMFINYGCYLFSVLK